MDIFRNLLLYMIPGRTLERDDAKMPFPPDIFPEDERCDDCQRNPPDHEWFGRPGGVFSDPHGFSSSFEDMKRRMDESFDEMFKAFGVDSLPMFDRFIPPDDGVHPAYRDEPPSRRGDNPPESVHNRMLKKSGDTDAHNSSPDINVRSRMLKGNLRPYSQSDKERSREDYNWDSLLQEGGSVNDILDGKARTPPNHGYPAHPDSGASAQGRSFSVRITTIRKSDGTVETRRITRDGSGNEHETVEVTKGS